MKKRKEAIPDKKINKKNFVIIFVVLCIVSVLGITCLAYRNKNKGKVSSNKAKNMEITIIFDNKEYNGTYDGKLKSGIPNGKGTFIDDENQFEYTGKWLSGVFDGKGEIIYSDGTKECGNFKEGKRQGAFSVYEKGNEDYNYVYYEEDIRYGLTYRNQNGKKENIDIYCNGITLDDIKNNAKELSAVAIQEGLDYDTVFKVKATIQYIVQTEDECYFRFESSAGKNMMCEYSNGQASVIQAYIPNLRVGDQVDLYVTFGGNVENKYIDDKEVYGDYFFSFKPLYAEFNDKSINVSVNNLIFEYDAIERFPYLYAKMDYHEEQIYVTKVKKEEKKKKNIYYIKGYSKEINEEYYFVYESETDLSIAVGSSINVYGIYDGQYKELNVSDIELKIKDNLQEKTDEHIGNKDEEDTKKGYNYNLYPRITVDKITIE